MARLFACVSAAYCFFSFYLKKSIIQKQKNNVLLVRWTAKSVTEKPTCLSAVGKHFKDRENLAKYLIKKSNK